MKSELNKLRNQSRCLEPSVEDRRRLVKHANKYVDRFYESLPGQKAYERFDDSVDSLLEDSIPEEPAPFEDLLHDIENRVIPPGLNTASGSHMGYIPGGGLASSAIGDYLAAVTNPYSGVYFSSPGAVNLERRLIRWMASLLGYPETSGGFLSSGGSIANLTAIVAAREAHKIGPEQVRKTVVYQTGQTHHCVDRALNVAGLKQCVRREIPMDDRFRMIPGELAKTIGHDRENGLRPWLVVASAGTTDTGAVDPLDEIGEITREHNLWYHVDAAYGGFFLLTEEGRALMNGIEQSDSAVLDPHKGLFLPYGLGALVVRDEKLLAEAHTYDASYMQDTTGHQFPYSPADLSPELSKHFRALRLWLPLKLHGVKAFRAALDEKRMLALYAWQKLREMDDFEVGPEPQLSVFLFRYNPGTDNPDELNRALHKRITDDGRIFFSTTTHNGSFMLRLAILSVRTHRDTIDEALKIIRGKAVELQGNESKF